MERCNTSPKCYEIGKLRRNQQKKVGRNNQRGKVKTRSVAPMKAILKSCVAYDNAKYLFCI